MKASIDTLSAAAIAATLTFSLGAQQRVANYDFENLTLTSASDSPATTTDLVATNTVVFGGRSGTSERWLCLTTDWNNTGGSLSWTVTPPAGASFSLTSLTWEARTNNTSLSDSVRAAEVFVNGNFVERVDPLTHNTDVVVDLSGVAGLRPSFAPVEFEIRFEGNPTGQTSYEIDGLNVQGSACVENLSTGPARAIFLPINGASGDARYWAAAEGFEFTENANGTALLRGPLVNLTDPCQRFTIEATLSGLVSANQAAPSGSPRVNNLVSNNLVANGGTIDTDTWRYYTDLNGTLTGRLCLEGASIDISRRGEALQIGEGANLKSLEMGLASWFNTSLVSQPNDAAFAINSINNGDFNLELGAGCACLADDVADWDNYGRGTAGCDGVPTLTLQRDPLTGSRPAIDIGLNSTAPANCALFWSFGPDNFFFPLVGGNLLVQFPLAAVDSLAIPAGGTTFNCNIRQDPCQNGWDIYLQAICLDPCGPTGFALSRGLRLGLGSL